MAPVATADQTVFMLLEVSTASAVCKLPILILFCGIWCYFPTVQTYVVIIA